MIFCIGIRNWSLIWVAGLDARCKRLSNGAQWFDIDVEESIVVRKKFFKKRLPAK